MLPPMAAEYSRLVTCFAVDIEAEQPAAVVVVEVRTEPMGQRKKSKVAGVGGDSFVGRWKLAVVGHVWWWWWAAVMVDLELIM